MAIILRIRYIYYCILKEYTLYKIKTNYIKQLTLITRLNNKQIN